METLKELFEEFGYTNQQVADGVQMSRRTLQNRLREPNSFTVAELKSIVLFIDSPECTLMKLQNIINRHD